MKKIKTIARAISIPLLVITIAWGLRTYGFRFIFISGASMEPTYSSRDIVFLNQLTPRFIGYSRGDVVVADMQGCEMLHGEYIVKRIIGLPGETVELKNDQVYIDGELLNDYIFDTSVSSLTSIISFFLPHAPASDSESAPSEVSVTLGNNEYFLLGDNRSVSLDSRNIKIGPVSQDRLLGRVQFKILGILN